MRNAVCRRWRNKLWARRGEAESLWKGWPRSRKILYGRACIGGMGVVAVADLWGVGKGSLSSSTRAMARSREERLLRDPVGGDGRRDCRVLATG